MASGLLRWAVRRLGRLRASAAERRLRAEVALLRDQVRSLNARLEITEQESDAEVRRLRDELAESEAQVAARTAEVEGYQQAHEHMMAMLRAHEAVFNQIEALGGMAQNRGRGR